MIMAVPGTSYHTIKILKNRFSQIHVRFVNLSQILQCTCRLFRFILQWISELHMYSSLTHVVLYNVHVCLD